MKNRVAFLLGLDTAMLLLVVVLECINVTGLAWHEWLGFAICPLVWLHVVLQWQWFVTQFQRVLTPGAWRVRVNAGLNLLLLVMMAAVLFSGVFVSRLATAWVGEGFGRVRIWSEVHGWLNFVLVLLVGLHLALNWDWMIAALRRRRPERPALATEGNAAVLPPRRSAVADASRTAVPPHPVPLPSEWGVRRTSEGSVIPKSIWTKVARSFRRAMVVLLVASVASGTVYFSMKAMLLPKWRARMEREQAVTVNREGNQSPPRSTEPARNPLAPRNRPPKWRDTPNLVGTLLLTVGVALIGRYVFRLRL